MAAETEKGRLIDPMLVSTVPGDIASGVAAAIAATVTALWRRCVVLEQQNHADNAAHFESTGDMYRAALDRQQAELDYLRKKAG